jgi:uncharacterized membrane protein (DUF485 family)
VFGLILPTLKFFFALFPYIVAGGIRIQEGLDRFSGVPPSVGLRIEHIVLLVSLIVMYIILPPLIQWTLERRRQWRQQPEKKKFPVTLALMVGITGLFVLTLLLSPIFYSISTGVFKSLQESQNVQSNRDALIHDLNVLALKAQSFYYVETSFGGGGKRWMDIERKDNSTFTLNEIILNVPNLQSVIGELFPQKLSQFSLDVIRRDSLIIWGIGTERGDDEEYTNRDGSKGRHQAHVIVTPKRTTLRFDN